MKSEHFNAYGTLPGAFVTVKHRNGIEVYISKLCRV